MFFFRQNRTNIHTHTTPRTVTLTHNEKYLRVLSLILVVVARLHTQRHVE